LARDRHGSKENKVKNLILLSSLFFIACSNNTPIHYSDKKEVPLNTIHWNEQTSQKLIADISSQMLKSSKFSTNKFYAFGHIRNDTLDHNVDTKILADSIISILKKNGNLSFIEYDKKSPKHHIDGYCTGSIYGDMQHDSNQRIMDFILKIHCTDTKTTLSLWSGESQKSNRLEKEW